MSEAMRELRAFLQATRDMRERGRKMAHECMEAMLLDHATEFEAPQVARQVHAEAAGKRYHVLHVPTECDWCGACHHCAWKAGDVRSCEERRADQHPRRCPACGEKVVTHAEAREHVREKHEDNEFEVLQEWARWMA